MTVDQASGNIQNTAIQTNTTAKLNWPLMLTGMLIALLFPASIHVYMLNVMRVPYPGGGHIPQWVSAINQTCSILALAVFYQLARPKLARLSVLRQCLIVSALFATVKQEILGMVMGGVFTTAYAYSFLTEVPEVLYLLLAGSFTVLVVLKIHDPWRKTTGAIVMAGVMGGVIHPLLIHLYAPFLKSVSYLSHATIYEVPLGWHVLVPAYTLTIEVVVACMVVAALMWPRLSSAPMLRSLQFALIVMFIKGEALRGTLYSFYLPFKLPLAFLSESQFFLEWVALTLLTALTWQVSQRSE